MKLFIVLLVSFVCLGLLIGVPVVSVVNFVFFVFALSFFTKRGDLTYVFLHERWKDMKWYQCLCGIGLLTTEIVWYYAVLITPCFVPLFHVSLWGQIGVLLACWIVAGFSVILWEVVECLFQNSVDGQRRMWSGPIGVM